MENSVYIPEATLCFWYQWQIDISEFSLLVPCKFKKEKKKPETKHRPPPPQKKPTKTPTKNLTKPSIYLLVNYVLEGWDAQENFRKKNKALQITRLVAKVVLSTGLTLLKNLPQTLPQIYRSSRKDCINHKMHILHLD